MLKRIRIILAYLFFIAFLLLFVDVSSTLPSYLSFLAKWQFIPALRAGSFVTLGVLLLITTLFGRVYCSTLCPLGVMQDMFFKFGKKYRFRFSKPKNKLRYIVLGVFVLSFVAHLPIVFGILEPYSAFGRIASAIVAPVWTVASNLLGSLFDGSGFITIAPTPV
ncbi:MAG: 4Fe-4S binding protein, partial [Polyangiaceae bacterium]|nr:4Fe-4S binding protein [Polyangiaceae bacterium]